MEKKLMTAKSYANAKIIKEYEKNGKMYATIKEKCDRCNGRGDYWWGAMINGRPQFSGTCYACNGMKYFIKEVRLYTEKELESMERANERVRQKKAEEHEAKMKAEYAQKKADWLAKNGFSPDGVTYIVTGDSYSIKDKLKEDGFRYDPVLKWHKADPTGYEDKTIKLNVEDAFEFSAWGEGHYITGAKDKINQMLAGAQPQETSVWIGEKGEKIKDIKVQLTRKYSFEGKYGLTTIYTFRTEEGNLLTWFSSTFQPYEVGDYMQMKYATIKDYNEYNGVKSTIITRAKLADLTPAI